MRLSECRVEWMRIGLLKNLTFMAKDIIVYSDGCFIGFYNTRTLERSVFQVNLHRINGEGVQGIIAHRKNLVFSYSEACSYPDTIVASYPDFKIISRLKAKDINGILQKTFSQTSLLITLAYAPSYTITVYNYVTSEKLVETKSPLLYEDQLFKCNYGKPEFMVQFGVQKQDIRLWDMFMFGHSFVFTMHVVRSSDNTSIVVCDAIWSPENNLFVLDSTGSVYMVNSKIILEKIIDGSIVNIEKPIRIIWFSGIAISDLDHVIRKFKKVNDTQWEEHWTVETEEKIASIASSKSNMMTYIGKLGSLNWLDDHGEILENVYNIINVSHIAMIYPTGDTIATIGSKQKLYIIKTQNGMLVTEYELENNPISLGSNPEFPYVAVGYDDGILELISAYKKKELKQMAMFRLTKNPISNIYFCTYGKIIVAGNLEVGEFFILEGFPGGTIKVVACVQTHMKIVDFMMVASKLCYRLFVIPVTSRLQHAGNKFVRYCVLNKNTITRKEFYCNDRDILYHRIVATNKPNRDRVFYVVPKGSKNIYEIETTRGSDLAKIISTIPSGHQLSHFTIRLTKTHAITCGYDGMVLVRDTEFQKEIASSMVHHRRFGGVGIAFIDPLEQYIISFGRESVFTCAKQVGNVISLKKRLDLMDLMKSPVFQAIFNRKTKGFFPEDGRTWLQVEEQKRFKEEKAKCKELKENILLDLMKIKKVIRGLITANNKGPENQKLELTEFNLDIQAYKDKCKKNDELCEILTKYYKTLISEQDKTYDYIKVNYFDTNVVLERQLHAIFQKCIVTNYALCAPNTEQMEENIKKTEYIKLENRCNIPFFPWVPQSQSEIQMVLSEKPVMNLDTLALEAREDITEDTIICMDGTQSSQFIENMHNDQYRMYTLIQSYQQQSLSMIKIEALKEYFNKEFDALMDQKEREMLNLRDKHLRQRKIISETNYFSTKNIFLDIEDPEWAIEENPKQYAQVFEYEIRVTPYISPSEQLILDAKAAEDERIRLLLLADDFKERALMAMMNGVLEIKWEDELKKDVPIPKCMLEKDPMTFNEEDLRAVKDYEDKVIFLNSERERYKTMLDIEFTKNCLNIKDTIKRFNKKVSQLNMLKMNVESAMVQEQMIISSRRLWHVKIMDLDKKRIITLEKIAHTEGKIEELIKLVRSLDDVVRDSKTKNETIMGKDKLLEKNFKREISEYVPLIQDMALKLYKKRPKASYKQITSATILSELSRCITSGERSVGLNQDGLDFLNSLDQLDSGSLMTPNMDEHIYANVCKSRRAKIELEIKLRAAVLELNYIETIVQLYNKRLAYKKELLNHLHSDFNEARKEKIHTTFNSVIQLVVRSGYVELALTGSVDDFDDAIIITKEEVENINSYIVASGKKKLDIMVKNMSFHRKVMDNEWRHVRRRMIINDLSEQLGDVLDVKLSKEIQVYLKQKSLGGSLKTNTLEMEMEQQKHAYMLQIKDLHRDINNFGRQMSIMKERDEIVKKDILNANIAINTLKTQIDPTINQKDLRIKRERMKTIVQRRNIVQQMQDNHDKIMILQTELELLRLKTYPTFQYKVLHKS